MNGGWVNGGGTARGAAVRGGSARGGSARGGSARGGSARGGSALRRGLVGLVIGGFAVLGLALPAAAHNTLTGSDPANGAAVATSPKQVTVRFNEPVQDGPNEMTVTGPDGASRWQATEQATVDGNAVHIPVRELGPAGRYTIGYHIISADGHPVSGSVWFTLTKAGHGTAVPGGSTTAPDSSSSGSGVPVWVWIVVAAVVLVAGVVVALRLSKPGAD